MRELIAAIGAFGIGYFGGQVLGHTPDAFIATLGISVCWAAVVLGVSRARRFRAQIPPGSVGSG